MGMWAVRPHNPTAQSSRPGEGTGTEPTGGVKSRPEEEGVVSGAAGRVWPQLEKGAHTLWAWTEEDKPGGGWR